MKRKCEVQGSLKGVRRIASHIFTLGFPVVRVEPVPSAAFSERRGSIRRIEFAQEITMPACHVLEDRLSCNATIRIPIFRYDMVMNHLKPLRFFSIKIFCFPLTSRFISLLFTLPSLSTTSRGGPSRARTTAMAPRGKRPRDSNPRAVAEPSPCQGFT